MDSIKRHILWIALLLQALLVFPRLDLLPMWGDERYTLQTSAQSPSGILAALRVDVHPPLYYFLVKGWLKLPLPASELARARALSALIALVATAALYQLWLKALPFERQALFLGLWVLSPFLILYARMARSYTLQLTLTLIAIRLARDWLRSPYDRASMARYVAAETVLLYTHYLPGLAVAAGTAAWGLWRRQWQQALGLAVIGLAYLPWLRTLIDTSGAVVRAHPYGIAPNAAVEHAVKLGYAFVAFNFGECIPAWVIPIAIALLPLIFAALWTAWQRTTHPPVLFLVAAAVGYVGAASWVTFAFVGARLLFLLPFYYLFLLRGLEIRRWRGAVTYAGLLLAACGGLSSYYRQQDFLNKGYLVDFEQITRALQQSSPRPPDLVLLDSQVSNAGYYLHSSFPYPVRILEDHASFEHAVEELHHHRPALVWYLRYGRDLTSGSLHGRLQHEISRDYQIEPHYFVPFSWLDRKVMEVLGLQSRPTHLIEAFELRRKG